MESPHDGRQYVFELNDRLIRDKELDGLTEIPLKPSPDTPHLKPVSDEDDGHTDELKVSEPSTLKGHFCFLSLWCHDLKTVTLLYLYILA